MGSHKNDKGPTDFGYIYVFKYICMVFKKNLKLYAFVYSSDNIYFSQPNKIFSLLTSWLNVITTIMTFSRMNCFCIVALFVIFPVGNIGNIKLVG